MDEIPDFTYPIWAISIEPIPIDRDGHPDPTNCKFWITEDDQGPLLCIFREFKLIAMCFNGLASGWKPHPVQIDSPVQFQWLRESLSHGYGCSVGANIDPDSNGQGFPLPASNWPDAEAN